jgi:hypothetical protein
MLDAAFLSLAKRLGNPIAERSGAAELLAFSTLTRACQASSRLERLLKSTFFRHPWLHRLTTDGSPEGTW